MKKKLTINTSDSETIIIDLNKSQEEIDESLLEAMRATGHVLIESVMYQNELRTEVNKMKVEMTSLCIGIIIISIVSAVINLI